MLEHFCSFGRCGRGDSIVAVPGNVEEIQEAFARATAENRRVVIRGGGHSFDGQSFHEGDSGSHVVMCTNKLTAVEFKGDLVTAGAGARWRPILEESLLLGFIPAILQTAGSATAGGTLAGDCLSRFSGVLGKESEWIESFTLVPPVGDPLPCSRRQNADVFHAAIGGHGYLGVATDITYRLLALPPRCGVHTEITTYHSLEELIRAQIPVAKRAAELGRGTRHARTQAREGTLATRLAVSPEIRAVSSVAFKSFTTVKGAVFESFYAVPDDPPDPPFPLYNNLGGGCRYAAELAARDDRLNRLFHESMFALIESGHNRFDDNIPEFSFFMDGNTFAKKHFEATHPGEVFPITQQTFVIPEEQTVEFTLHCLERLKNRRLTPTELDVLFVLADDCLMSATHGNSGFAVSIAFENYSTACPPSEVDELLRELSVLCSDAGGRIHLVKNVRADKAVLRHMFRSTIDQFESIKGRLDPNGILRNAFFDRIF